MATGMYAAITKAVPIYNTQTTNLSVTASNISSVFTVANSSYYFVGSGSTFTTNNGGVKSTTAQTTLTALYDMTISFTYSYSSEQNYDKFTLTVGGTTVENAVSGATTTKTYSGTIAKGKTIVFTYAKDGSTDSNNDKCTFSNMQVTYTVQTQTGTENKVLTSKITKNYAVIDGKTRNIAKMYAVVDGKTRLIFSSGFGYTYIGLYGEKTGAYQVTAERNGNVISNITTSASSASINAISMSKDGSTAIMRNTAYQSGNPYSLPFYVYKYNKSTRLYEKAYDFSPGKYLTDNSHVGYAYIGGGNYGYIQNKVAALNEDGSLCAVAMYGQSVGGSKASQVYIAIFALTDTSFSLHKLVDISSTLGLTTSYTVEEIWSVWFSDDLSTFCIAVEQKTSSSYYQMYTGIFKATNNFNYTALITDEAPFGGYENVQASMGFVTPNGEYVIFPGIGYSDDSYSDADATSAGVYYISGTTATYIGTVGVRAIHGKFVFDESTGILRYLNNNGSYNYFYQYSLQPTSFTDLGFGGLSFPKKPLDGFSAPDGTVYIFVNDAATDGTEGYKLMACSTDATGDVTAVTTHTTLFTGQGTGYGYLISREY